MLGCDNRISGKQFQPSRIPGAVSDPSEFFGDRKPTVVIARVENKSTASMHSRTVSLLFQTHGSPARLWCFHLHKTSTSECSTESDGLDVRFIT